MEQARTGAATEGKAAERDARAASHIVRARKIEGGKFRKRASADGCGSRGKTA